MKRWKKESKVAKGAPSGFVISLLVHAGLVAVAAMVVVVTITTKPEEGFRQVAIPERTIIKTKPPRVRIVKNPHPAPSERIVATVKTDRMPEFTLPDLAGKGHSLFDGVGPEGMYDMEPPDLPSTAISDPDNPDTGNNLIATYYNLNRRRDGTKLHIDHPQYFAILRDFVRSGWKTSTLARYYRSPNKLKATTIMIPITSSTLGPAAFGEDINEGYCWVVHYKGRLAHKEGITFRFWGAADDVLTVRVGGKVVLAANFEWTAVDAHTIADDWVSHAPNNRKYRLANSKMVGGDWITLEPGVPLDMEAIAGEGPGGEFHAQLLVEVKGEKYPLNNRGAPIFPIFAMEEPSWALQNSILENMFEGEANVTQVTTIFRDH